MPKVGNSLQNLITIIPAWQATYGSNAVILRGRLHASSNRHHQTSAPAGSSCNGQSQLSLSEEQLLRKLMANMEADNTLNFLKAKEDFKSQLPISAILYRYLFAKFRIDIQCLFCASGLLIVTSICWRNCCKDLTSCTSST